MAGLAIEHLRAACRCAVAAVNVALSMLLLVGCAALNPPEVNRAHNYGDASIGDLHVRGVRAVKSADDRAVGLVATIVNSGPPVVLSQVTVKAGNANGSGGTVAPLSAEPNLSIAAEAVVRVGGPGAPRIHLPDPQRRLRAGRVATVTLSFTGAGVTAVEVIVEEPEAYLAPYAPPPTTGRAP